MEVEAGATIYPMYNLHVTYTEGQQPKRDQVVGGCILRHTPVLTKPHRRYHVIQEWVGEQYVKTAKINTKISMEAEIIGADDVLPGLLWTRYFI